MQVFPSHTEISAQGSKKRKDIQEKMNKQERRRKKRGVQEKRKKSPYAGDTKFFQIDLSAVIIKQMTEIFEKKLVTKQSGNTF